MPNVATFLKAEIVRVARKEASNELIALRKASDGHRRQIAALKREVSALQRKANVLAKQAGKSVNPQEPQAKVRFSAKGFRSMRARLGYPLRRWRSSSASGSSRPTPVSARRRRRVRAKLKPTRC